MYVATHETKLCEMAQKIVPLWGVGDDIKLKKGQQNKKWYM